MASSVPYKQCPRCGANHPLQAPYCPNCGHQFSTNFAQGAPQTQAFYAQQQPGYQPENPYQRPGYPQPGYQMAGAKSKIAAALLAFFLGSWGAHRFYLGHTQSGIWMLVLNVVGIATSWLFGIGLIPIMAVGIWSLIDFVMILTGQLGDATGQPLSN